jgi:hypothetical protein
VQARFSGVSVMQLSGTVADDPLQRRAHPQDYLEAPQTRTIDQSEAAGADSQDKEDDSKDPRGQAPQLSEDDSPALAPSPHSDAPSVIFKPTEANSVCLIGKVMADPDFHTMESGAKVSNMKIAVWQGQDKEPLWCAQSLSVVRQFVWRTFYGMRSVDDSRKQASLVCAASMQAQKCCKGWSANVLPTGHEPVDCTDCLLAGTLARLLRVFRRRYERRVIYEQPSARTFCDDAWALQLCPSGEPTVTPAIHQPQLSRHSQWPHKRALLWVAPLNKLTDRLQRLGAALQAPRCWLE